MSGNVKQFVDFTGNTNNDTGENNSTSIQPIQNGEVVDQTVSGRPDESLRQRTEAIRDIMADSLYLRDSDRNFVAFCLGGVTWPGSTTASASGIPVLTDVLWLVPLLTPGTVQVGAPPIASVFGVLHLKRSSDSANSISVTSRRRSYAAGDQINVTVTSGGVFSCALDVETGLRRTIKIVATGTTTLGAVITALNGLIPPAPDNTQLVTAALEGGASSGDFLLAPQARQLVTGNYDAEGHQVAVSTMSSFFSSNPTQALAEGDTLCIRYDMVTDLASTGGRRQSLVENSNTSVPAGSLFNSRVHPEFLANALPVCKVLNNKLVFGTGIEIPPGSVNAPLGGSAQGIAYGGGSNWADGTTNPATTVELQLDKIISDLSPTTGSAKIGGAASTNISAGTLAAQIINLATNWLKLSRDNIIAGIQTFSQQIIASVGILVGVDQNIILSGFGYISHGTRTKLLHACNGITLSGAAWVPGVGADGLPYMESTGVGTLLIPVEFFKRNTLELVNYYIWGNGVADNVTTVFAFAVIGGVMTALTGLPGVVATDTNPGAAWNVKTMSLDPIGLDGTSQVFMTFAANAAGIRISNIQFNWRNV